jgi:hypothetical protein
MEGLGESSRGTLDLVAFVLDLDEKREVLMVQVRKKEGRGGGGRERQEREREGKREGGETRGETRGSGLTHLKGADWVLVPSCWSL